MSEASSVLVSVIIPIHNHAAFLRECLDSLVAETYPNLELIAIDDGSSDDSFALASEWIAHHRSRFARVELVRQENVGLVVTLNRLLGRSTGEYVAPIASDDVLLPGGIAARVRALQANPRWLTVFGDCVVLDETGRVVRQSALVDLHRTDKVALKSAATIESELIWRWAIPGPATMTRRTAYFGPDGIGLYPEDIKVEDRYFYLHALSKKAVGFVDFPVAGYRLHRDQMTAKSSPMVNEGVFKAEERLIGQFTGSSYLALWLGTMILHLDRNMLATRIPRSALWRARTYAGRVVLYQNSKKARKMLARESARQSGELA